MASSSAQQQPGAGAVATGATSPGEPGAGAGATGATSPDEPGALAAPLASPAEWEAYHSRWEGIWRNGCAPGQFFDKASSSPSLLSLLSLPLTPAQERHLAAAGGGGGSGGPPPAVDARGKRALVPGCGRGYDVVAFARAGAAEAVGLELSAAAAEAARSYVAGELAGGQEAARARVQQGDFFDAGALPPASFDLGYDLTFLCALHPGMREGWARRWALLLRPGGRLVTACFPIDPSRDQNAGPPWPLTPALYERLLLGGREGAGAQGGGDGDGEGAGRGDGGGEGAGDGTGGGAGGGAGSGGAMFRKVYLAPVPPGMSVPDRAGLEWLGIWERL